MSPGQSRVTPGVEIHASDRGSQGDVVTSGWYSCTMRWELEWGTSPDIAPFTPDPDQMRALEHRAGPLMLVGAAGSGTTTTLIHSVAQRIHAGVDPRHILVITFGKRAVRECRELLAALTPGSVLPTVGTFHSVAYSLLAHHAEGGQGVSVLSGAEEDARIMDIIRGLHQDAQVDLGWPDALNAAATTRTFAREVRAVIARLKELRITGADLVRLGEMEDRPEWIVAGQIAMNESEIMDLEGTLDYSELLIRAAREAEHSPVIRGLTHLFIDEYQEIGPLHHDLVLQIARSAGQGRGLTECMVAANPQESIFTFRGSETRFVEQFAEDFPGASSITLSTFWRGSATIGQAAQAVYPHGLAAAYQDYPHAAVPDAVRINRYGNRTSRAAFLAQDIRGAHVEEGVPWRSMAVIARASSDIPTITRALMRHSIPVVVATDDIPLSEEPAVRILLAVLSAAAHPAGTSAQAVQDLLTGPLGGLDSSDIRRLGRALRREERTTPSAQLIRELVLNGSAADIPAALSASTSALDSSIGTIVIRLQGLLGELRRGIARDASISDLLWLAWTGGHQYAHGWPERLRAAALAHNPHAHHDIDAVMALFDSAERFTSRGRSGVVNYLAALMQQKLPAEPVAARGLRADAVQVMSVHQSKGQQWDRVWITSLEEGMWPHLAVRGSVLHPDEITPEGVGAGANQVALLREERDLFYVAVTRARERVTLTCIDQGDEGGDQPSRFIADLVRQGVPDHAVIGFPRSRTSIAGLTAELRSVLADPAVSVGLKESAGALLAQIGPQVGPDTWWGHAPLTESTRPIRPRDRALHMSGSSLDALIACPLKWFLDKEVKAQVSRGAATAFGSIVHAVAEYVAKGDVPANVEAMQELINSSWRQVVYESPWQSSAELAQAHAAAARFLRYHQAEERVYVDAERELRTEVEVQTPSGTVERIELTGFVDRVEQDASGHLVAIDLKNMRNAVPTGKIPEHGQLGVYQLLLADQQPPEREHADLIAQGDLPGAALVQLRVEGDTGKPKIQSQSAIDFRQSPTWIELKLGEAADIIRNETFFPIEGEECRYCSYHAVCPAKTTSIFEPPRVVDSDD